MDSTLNAGTPRVVSTSPVRRARRSLTRTVARIPQYLRLFGGMLRDPRVSRLDRALVFGAIAYVVSPFDLIPDFLPFLGQVDDLFLVATAVTRLFERAGRTVVLDHWEGDPSDLDPSALRRVLMAAALFLPPRARRRLRRLARG